MSGRRPSTVSVLVTLATAVVMGLITILVFPWGVSAYHLERAGRWLDAETTSAAAGQAAEQELVRALKWYPDNAQAYRLLALLYRYRGDRVAALDAQARFVALQPKNPLGLWELAHACEQMAVAELAQVPGQPCGADAPGRQAMLIHLWQRSGHTADSFVEAGDLLREREEWKEAEAFYQRALLLDPGAAAAYEGLAELHEARDGSEAALESYANVITTSQDAALVASAYHDRGRILADALRWEEASWEFGQAVAVAPDEGQYHLDYGWALFKAGGEAEGVHAELAMAAELMPENPWPDLHLSQVAYAAEDYSGALEHAQKAVVLNPDLFWGWMRQGMALRRLDRLADSEQSLRQAVELGAEQALVHAELGYTLNRQEKVEEAIQEFEQAVSLAPENVQYSLSLANAYRKVGQIALAVEMYRRVLERDPENAAALEALRKLGY